MKKELFVILLLLFSYVTYGQDSLKIYNPQINANTQIKEALLKAKNEKKHVYLQVGGNWCPWCIKLNNFCKKDKQIDSLMNASYVTVHINYSKENKNPEVMKQLGFPQRFGFPVLVILDADGNRIHTQNSSYLEEGKGYDRKKILEFLGAWVPAALDPKNYQNK